MAPLLVGGAATLSSFLFFMMLIESSFAFHIFPPFNSDTSRLGGGISTKVRRRNSRIISSITTLNAAVQEEEEAKPIRVGIAGCGSVAFGTASLLSQNGHDTMLFSPSGRSTPPITSNDNYDARASITSTGAITRTFQSRIASSVDQLVNQNDVILLALPANGHMSIMDALVPHITSRHVIIISSHSSLGGIYLCQQLLAKRNITIPIVAWGTTVVTARRSKSTNESSSDVNVCTIRSVVDMCTIPSHLSSTGWNVCNSLFGTEGNNCCRFQQRDGLLAISLSNLNAQNHLGIVLGNMSRMERHEQWSQGLNITPNIGRLLESLDQERMTIAKALRVDVRTIQEHFHLSFHVPMTSSISEMNSEMVKMGNDVNGPSTADTRYVTEDVPYGLVLIVNLGKLVNKPAVLHEAGIRIVGAMYGRDFWKENDLLNALKLIDVDDLDLDHDVATATNTCVEDLVEAGRTGILRKI
eukprot:CAMPEP_0195526300 /NCGR_PEP_ID=MMETSP0794_2-20130614/27284_1 /TAXON_ID=515487 /ORGANISM="Stephanopyxis turris, Strain CCMP 815" /LENGTH=469 /DNA_ID=CAMNT_0040656953 /DNA_START=35 /DNA_END=1444 /DNA_ORIENTATION=-